MTRVRGAMTDCAKIVCSCSRPALLSGFTPPVAASLSKRPARGFTLSTIPNRPLCQREIPKYNALPQGRYPSFISSLPSSSAAEWKELSTEARKDRLMLLDGKAFIYRAYHRISSRVLLLCKARIFHGFLKKETTCEELPENSSWDSIMTTVVALTEILTLLELRPSHAAVVFDFPVRDTKHALLGMGVKVIEVPGVEADDVIGTLSVQAVEAGMKVRIASLDKDFFQILSPQLRLLRFQQKGLGFSSFGLEGFNLRYPGLQISQFVDMQALVGDLVDNIPGVRGIGDVAATKLISQFGTLENLLAQRDKITQTRARNALLEDNGQVLLSKYLLSLKLNIPEFAIGCSLQNLSCRGPQDGGRSYSGLVDAFGAIVGREAGAALLERTFEYWRKF